MKPLILISLLFVLPAGSAFAQKKYLVSPHDEVIPIKENEYPRSIIAKRAVGTFSTATTCGTRFMFGSFPEDGYPVVAVLGARHKDVIGDWFVAQATGTIDTIWWLPMGNIGALDSTVYVRVSGSRIGPDYGPGIRPGPFNPPCQNWGYYSNTNDLDEGITAFPEDATDTTWHSTYNGPANSLPPFTNSIWGHTGVWAKLIPNSFNHLAMMDIGSPLNVVAGETFFISIRINGPTLHPVPLDSYTYFSMDSYHVTNNDENYPSRLWKFYEHDSGPANCSGLSTNLAKRGWTARGGITSDSLDIAELNIWYQMTVTSNAPPLIEQTDILHNTFSTGSQEFTANISDCDPAVLARAGVALASVKWQLNNVAQPDIAMSNIGGDTWMGTLPGEPSGSTVIYKVYAQDSTGASSTGVPVSYGVFQIGNGFVQVDTSGGCVSKAIHATGTKIDTGSFFLPPLASPTAQRLDDGTAGPFDIGSNMLLFGDVGRYVWVGIDGGIAISKTLTDTIDVNANGQFAANWTFPLHVRHAVRNDTTNIQSSVPKNFFAAFWTDLQNIDGSGRILHQKGFGGDSCWFIVEWDSIGPYSSPYIDQPEDDEGSFRIVLNKCTGVIEYQYDGVGTFGQDSTALVGFEADSTALTVPNQALNPYPANILFNDYGYPIQSRPRNGWCVRFYPAVVNPAIDGWNLISVSVIPANGDYSVRALFPNAISRAYSYRHGTYVVTDTLELGVGYWLKQQGSSQNIGAHGSYLYSGTDSVDDGWNLIGVPISFPVPKVSIIVGGGAVVASNYFGYNNSGYYSENTLKPGLGYWVKVDGSAGTLSMSGAPGVLPKAVSETDLDKLNKITISGSQKQTLYIGDESLVKEPVTMYDLPPAGREFDARFGSGRLVETYPAHLDAKAQYEYPIQIKSDRAVTIQWNVVSGSAGKLTLMANGKNLAQLSGSGKVTLKYEEMKDVKLTLGDGVELPKVFGLSQNYPNPFNPTTEIRYQIADFSRVVLKIYDVLGQEIKTLVDEPEEAGYKSVSWNANDIASGMYFYKLTATGVSDQKKSFVEVKKMVLVR